MATSLRAALAVVLLSPSALAAAPGKLAGVLVCDRPLLERWGLAGAWFFPVGDPRDFSAPDPAGAPGYRLSRGLEPRREGAMPHHGADLENRRAGGAVRAAANGLVVLTEPEVRNGYGVHVVVAHHLTDGAIAYTVYAHLAAGSIAVRSGEQVTAGSEIGRVGRSGRASTDHLHFEVRMSHAFDERWERARALDPIDFVERRLPAVADSSCPAGYLEWAACSALIPRATSTDRPLVRGQWWEMLARASREPMAPLPAEASDLRAALIESAILAADGPRSKGRAVGWKELAADLRRLEARGLGLLPCPVPAAGHRALCESRLGDTEPSGRLERLVQIGDRPPTLLDACLLLADLRAREGPAAAIEP
jgi:hypothetical protein